MKRLILGAHGKRTLRRMMARNMLFIFYKELKRALTPIQVTPQQAIEKEHNKLHHNCIHVPS
jgi:hypothetical protein